MRSVIEMPQYEFSCNAGALMLGASLDQTIANRTTDFNPDWIRMILLLVSELVKLGFIVSVFCAQQHRTTELN